MTAPPDPEALRAHAEEWPLERIANYVHLADELAAENDALRALLPSEPGEALVNTEGGDLERWKVSQWWVDTNYSSLPLTNPTSLVLRPLPAPVAPPEETT